MLMDRIVKIWLLPRYANLMGRHLLQSYLWRRWNIQTEFFHQDIVGRLTDLPGPIQQPFFFFNTRQWGPMQNHQQPATTTIQPRQQDHLPDQRPQNANRQKQSHDAPNPHRRNHARVGIKREVQRLIHSRVEHPWTRESVRKTKTQRKKHRADPNPVPHAVVAGGELGRRPTEKEREEKEERRKSLIGPSPPSSPAG